MSWRRHAVELLGDLRGKIVLDLCCGTGDFLHILKKKYGNDIRLCGVDFASQMLTIARERFEAAQNVNIMLCQADALKLPYSDNTIDAVTIGFGIRNIHDRPAALKEIRRILKPGGRLVMIEPARPPNAMIRFGFTIYFKYISPTIGGMISGDRSAYKYLHDSFVAFPTPDEFKSLMCDAGLTNVKATPQTFGTAMIYYGEK
jgi:demethylmenaquinone methyltransferase/2-methoxy-6-polyprenyl-1,4-benzoquinol methylase